MGKLWEPSSRYNMTRANSFRKNSSRPWKGFSGRKFFSKFMGQTVVSIMIFLLVLGVFQVKAAWASKTQDVVRNWFTEDYNIETVIKLFSAVGLWGDTFDRAALEVSQPELNELVVPVSGQITRPYGWGLNSEEKEVFSDGILIAAAEGTPVRAAMAGKVSRIANDENLGRIIEVSDNKGYTVTYGHCKEILINLEDEVTAGQIIAKVGQTGKAGNTQLYLRIIKDKEAIDPAKVFLPTGAKT